MSHSGFQAAARYWPDTFRGVSAATRLRVLADMARVRPVLVRGAEAMVMVRPLPGSPERRLPCAGRRLVRLGLGLKPQA